MKQKIHFKLLIALLLLPGIALATTSLDDTYLKKNEKERTIEKSFSVSPNATLKIDNTYGNVDVITWEKNTIDFDIIIRVSGNNEDKVEDRFDRIDVEFNATNDMVSAKTIIGKNKSNWWNWGKKMNLKLEINYVVKMPMTNNVNISNDYGYITLDKIEGQATLNCDYGKITTKELMAENNSISFDYSRGCYFEYINSGKINADYSSFTVSKAKNIQLNADYTKSNIEVVENIVYNCDYNALTIEKANSVEGNGDYLSLRLGDVYKNVSIKADYGSIKIDKMSANAGNIEIQSDYAGISIGYEPGYNFNFEFNMEYGSLRNTDDFNFIKKRIKSSEKYYSGYYGNANSGNKIYINSEYGSVSFKKQ